jgi:hypothetical protein
MYTSPCNAEIPNSEIEAVKKRPSSRSIVCKAVVAEVQAQIPSAGIIYTRNQKEREHEHVGRVLG